MTSVDLQEADQLAQSLSEALSSGDSKEAVKLAQRLSELSLPVSVSVDRDAYPQQSIYLKVGIADAQSDNNITVTIEVSLKMTIEELKEKINHEYGFHPALQRWVIGKRLAQDKEMLYSHRIRQNGDQAFLFIISANAAHLTRHREQMDREEQILGEILDSVCLLPRGVGEGPISVAPEHKQPPLEPPKIRKPDVLPKPKLGWSCGQCTYLNKPTRPGCEMCGGERPEQYQVPDIYKPDHEEIQRLQQEQLAMLQYQQSLVEERKRNFQTLLETDGYSLVPNSSEADCPICFLSLNPGEGATLRDCLHTFCRECLKGTIVNSQDAEVTCPFMDNNYSCDSMLQDREIKALLTEDEHQKFLELRLSIAESRSAHSFHCQTPNCKGWCIYEDEVNEFDCELCKATNCILCKAIHTDMNCKEYQDDLRVRAENDLAAKQTKEMLDGLLQRGEAMCCPCCDVIVQKKDGCDWIRCLMCKMEICWVTKQARWGPNGSGDTSGGCRCRVNNLLCHPNCQNCH